MSGSDEEEIYVEKIDDREWGIVWNKYSRANGRIENIPSASHLRKFLGKLHINLTEKSCETLMIICKKKGQIPFVHLTTLKSVIKEALDSYNGLPVDQAIGGLIVEFNASSAGRQHRNYQSMQSMQAIVAASTKSLSHYALSKVKESPQDKQKRKAAEKRKREEKRRKLHDKQHGKDTKKVSRSKKTPQLTHENLRKKNAEKAYTAKAKETATLTTNRYATYLPPVSDDDDGSGDSNNYSPSSVVINHTPGNSQENNPDFPTTNKLANFPAQDEKYEKMDKLSPTQALGTNFGRTRSPSSDVALQRKSAKNKKEIAADEKSSYDAPDISVTIATGAAPQQVIEILKRQENMLYRIQTQMTALDKQIHQIEHHNTAYDDNDGKLRECMLELQYLKTSAIAGINAELASLKMELFDTFESISISAAYNVSQDIKHDLHCMNNKISNSVRLWGNDWNVKKRILSNQQKLDHVLFKAQKILGKYEEQQSNLKSIKYHRNRDIKMNVPQFIAEMDSIRSSLKSMDHYLNTFVFDRLSRMENALVRIFEQSSNLQDPQNDQNNKIIKRFSVDELMNQLDSQRLHFEGQLKNKSHKISNQKEELALLQRRLDAERERIQRESEQFTDLKGKCERQQAANKQLQFELKSMKSQLERAALFDYSDSGAAAPTAAAQTPNKLLRATTTLIHPDISPGLHKNVDLSLEFDKFYSNSLSSLIGDFISKSKLDNKEKANEYHKNKESGHLRFRKDQVPKFLSRKNNRDAQQQELEDRLGFGYEELYYLYRENTEINVTCNRLKHEAAALRQRLKDQSPVIIVENVSTVNIAVQHRLSELHDKLRGTEAQWKEIEEGRNANAEQSGFIDKYRIEMLQDSKKVQQEISSQMNYDKFQFQRQRKKMNALMKSEKEGVLKEREIMEDERLQIEELKLEWKEKLAELQRKEQEFDEKVVLAKSNMNEVVFQKGLSELLKKHNEELKYELRQHVDKEMVKDETEHIREECNQQVVEQREYYNKRFSIQTNKNDKLQKECDTLKLQIKHCSQQIEKLQADVLLRDEHYEKMSGSYDRLEREYQILKKSYKTLEKQKNVESKEDADSGGGAVSSSKKAKKKKRRSKKSVLPWLEEDSDDDEMTKLEKKSIAKWLKQRHGVMQNDDEMHWLVLPEDQLLGKEKDIEDLAGTVKLLKQELDGKNKLIGAYKQQVAQYEEAESKEDYLLQRLEKRHKGTVHRFDEEMETVKKWLRVWEDGIKTVTKAQHKWTQKHSELVKKEKEIQKEKEDLIYDQRMWYAHKNHILRRFFYFTKQVWWHRFMVHEFQKSRADQEMQLSKLHSKKQQKKGAAPQHHLECPLWNQYFKMMLEAWFETGIYQHALTRWFCQYNTYSKEKDLFYYGENSDNNEELYLFKDDIVAQIASHLDSIIERYYKQKWLKRRMKFGRCFIAAEKPKVVIDKSFYGFQKVVRDLFNTLHEKEPSYHGTDISVVIARAEQEMDDKINCFSRSCWDMVKMTDGVGVVSVAQQKRQKAAKQSNSRRKSSKHSTKIATPTPIATKKQKKVRIASKEVGRTSKSMKQIHMAADREDEKKEKEKEKEEKEKERERASMKTPKASSQQKTWSHAMDNFKSVKKKEKKKMTAEEKKKLRQKRKQQRSDKNKEKNRAGGQQKRSSLKNPMSALGGSFKIRPANSSSASIKMIQPDK